MRFCEIKSICAELLTLRDPCSAIFDHLLPILDEWEKFFDEKTVSVSRVQGDMHVGLSLEQLIDIGFHSERVFEGKLVKPLE